MLIYLKDTIEPVKKGGDGSGARQLGVSRGGNYVARVQIGYEKDNSPRYRYFKTLDEYKEYLAKVRDKKSKEKGDKKQSESKGEDDSSQGSGDKKREKASRQSLFVRH
jgi:hypothetical protein